MVNRDKAGELKRVLEKVFHERCGLPVEVEYEYVPPVRAKASIQRELQAQQEAERMTAKVAAVLGLSEATGTDGAFADAGDGTGSQSGAGFGNKQNVVHGGGAGQLLWQAARRREVESLAVPKKPVLLRKQAEMLRVDLPAARPNLGSCVPEAKRSLRRNDWSSGGYRKKSDNPDVLFGRDFEDDFIHH